MGAARTVGAEKVGPARVVGSVGGGVGAVRTVQGRPSEDSGRGAVGAVREGGDDVEWVGKALTAVETERVWNGERGSVGEALKTVWVVGWRCRQLSKPVASS